MLRLILRWILNALLLLVVSRIVPGFIVTGFGTALIAALVIGLVNATLGLLLKVLTFPLSLITFGLFLFVINALMLELAAKLVSGFYVRGFWPAFCAAVLLAVLNMILRWIWQEHRQG